MPLFSVIMPAYNRADLIGRTLDSALNQTFRDFEIIVTDDGSKDETAKIVEEYAARGVRLVRQANAGEGAARNAAIRQATGDYLAFLDSDDLWFPWTLETFARAISEHGRPPILTCQPRKFVNESELDGFAAEPFRIREFRDLFTALRQWDFFVGAGGTVVRRELVGPENLFPEIKMNAPDLDFLFRLGTASPLVCIDAPVALAYRQHPSSAMGNPENTRKGLAYLLAQERAGKFPGGPNRGADRAYVLGVLTQPWSFIMAREGRTRMALDVYRRSLRVQLRRGNLWYVCGFPVWLALHKLHLAS